jgi:hypothetical protein
MKPLFSLSLTVSILICSFVLLALPIQCAFGQVSTMEKTVEAAKPKIKSGNANASSAELELLLSELTRRLGEAKARETNEKESKRKVILEKITGLQAEINATKSELGEPSENLLPAVAPKPMGTQNLSMSVVARPPEEIFVPPPGIIQVTDSRPDLESPPNRYRYWYSSRKIK